MAQPSPNPTSSEPVTTASVPPAKTTMLSTRAAVAPVASDPAMMRSTGPGFAAEAVVTSSR